MSHEVPGTGIRARRSSASARDESRKVGTEPIGPVPGPEGPWLARHRYFLLATAVTILASIQTANGQW